MLLLLWQGFPSAEAWQMLAGLSVVAGDGTTLGAAMADRAGASLLIVVLAVVLAACGGFAVAFAASWIGWGLPRAAGLAARLLALFPLAALGWAAVGFIVGRHGWPIESLLPHHPAPGRDTEMLALGRTVWWWSLPVLLLMLPLAGEICSETLDRFSSARSLPLTLGLRSRGLPGSWIHYRHLLPAVWPGLLDRLEWLGILGLGYLVFVEEALGVPGWGGFLADAVKAGDVRGIAGGLHAAGCLAAAWSSLAALVRWLTVAAAGGPRPVSWQRPVSSPVMAAWITGSVLVLAAAAIGYGGADWISKTGAFASRYLPLLGNDLSALLLAALLAALLAVALAAARSGLAAVLSSAARFPRLGVLESLCWSPLLVWAAAFSAPMGRAAPLWMLLGLLAAFALALEFRGFSQRLRARNTCEESISVGASRPVAWARHVLPGLLRCLLAGFLAAFSSLAVALVLLDSLPAASGGAPGSLGAAISAAKENALSDRASILAPAALAAICALCFRQLIRIIHPGPPPAPPHE